MARDGSSHIHHPMQLWSWVLSIPPSNEQRTSPLVQHLAIHFTEIVSFELVEIALNIQHCGLSILSVDSCSYAGFHRTALLML